jgi:hypothetical protein
MRLYVGTRVINNVLKLLDDSSSLADQNVLNDSTITLFLRKQSLFLFIFSRRL